MQLTFYALPCDKVAKLALDLVWIKAVLRVKLHSEPALNYPPLAQPIARTELLEHFRIFNKNLWNTGHFGQISLLQGQDVNAKLISHFLTKHETWVSSVNRVAKCHRYGRYICGKILEGWGKKCGRPRSFVKWSSFRGRFTNLDVVLSQNQPYLILFPLSVAI